MEKGRVERGGPRILRVHGTVSGPGRKKCPERVGFALLEEMFRVVVVGPFREKGQRDHLGPAIPVGHFPEKPELAAGGTILAETWCSESCPACMGRFREGAKEQIARGKVVSLKGFIGAV